MFLFVLFDSARKAHLAIFTLKTIKTYNLRPIEPLIFFYKFFSAAKRTKSCRHLKIRGSAAPRAETDASRETAAGCARSGGALSRRGDSDRVIRLLAVPSKASILCRSWTEPPFFFCLYARPQSLSILCNALQPQFPRGERFASYPFLHARFRTLAFPLIFKRRIFVPPFQRKVE